MEKVTVTAERVFSQAIALPRGAARDQWVAAHCGEDPALRQEVESLLRAHEAAGDFLQAPTTLDAPPGLADNSVLGLPDGTMNAAAWAAVFLQSATQGDNTALEEFLVPLPPEIRSEIRERILAGLRARRIRAPIERAGVEREEPLPRVPGFRLERKLGEGGLGVVYAAHDEKLDRRVALKLLRSPADASVRQRVLEEARKAAALSDPAVVTIFSVLDDSDPPAIVMEWVDGFPLDRFAEQLSFEQKARLLREVARGLAAAHARELVHRDLKPDNILVGPDMRPRILDFGLAVSLAEASHLKGGFAGTPLYASPEQVMDRPLTPASDVFSFGGVMFKVLTGQPPFKGGTVAQVLEAIATSSPPFLREITVGVPKDLQAICLACLAWNPADRPTAGEVAIELGRFLVGEAVRLKPKLYDDVLRRSISEYSSRAQAWERQSIISREERDALEVLHRRLLADEDHWIVDARRITALQTVLSGATWLAVVGTVLMVWLLRDDLGPPWRWLIPTMFPLTLLGAGQVARRQRETLAAATFLAGATLTIAPSTLSLLAELRICATPPEHVTQLFAGIFTNQQVLAASLTALAVSVFGFWRLKMTGFAWTTAALSASSYLSLLLLFNWLAQKPETQALWCLPLAAMEPVALFFERRGRVRWTLPFHLAALGAVVIGLDIIAWNGPSLKMLGVGVEFWPYFDQDRQAAFSMVLNGMVFLGIMLATARSASLDLRRGSKLFEVLAIVHTLSALYANAINHRHDIWVRVDAWLYVGAALAFVVLAPFRSRWRLLVGGLAGCGLGSYLLVDLGLVARKPFILGLGFAGLLTALGTFIYVRRRSRSSRCPPIG